MTPRRGLIGFVGFGMVAASTMIGTLAASIAQKDAAKTELARCTDYSGLPRKDDETAGMVFIPAGTFIMGSERHQPEERSVG
jgi:formylglycine-generating enzyme required for sulfatase activity